MRPVTEASRAAVRRGHSRTTVVTLHSYGVGQVAELPVHDGWLRNSLSTGGGERYGEVRIPGYNWFDTDYLSTPTWLEVTQTIEGESWDLGQWPIAELTEERPGGLVTIRLGDWANRRDRYVAQVPMTLDPARYGPSVAEFFERLQASVTPGGTFTVTRDDTLGGLMLYSAQLRPGDSLWRAVTRMANAIGAYAVVDSMTEGSVRVFDPYAPVHEDIGGTVTRSVLSLSADRLYNQVLVWRNSSNRESGNYYAVRNIESGPWAFDRDGIGRTNLVDSETVEAATQGMADMDAQRLYDRQAGAVYETRLEVVPHPWLEVGDVVSWSFDDRTGSATINDVEYPLRADGVMRLVMREVPTP